MFYERNKKIAIMILSGTTYYQAAKEFSLTPERVRQITAALCEKVDPDIFFSARMGVRTFKMRVLRDNAAYLIRLIHNIKPN